MEAHLGSVRLVGLFLHEASAASRLSYEVAFGLELAVHEAVENAIRHGLRQDAARRLHLHFRSTSERVEVTLSDDGPPFDPLSLAPPVHARRLEDVIPGGQGVHLMRHFTDELRYRRERGHNVLTLARVLARTAPTA